MTAVRINTEERKKLIADLKSSSINSIFFLLMFLPIFPGIVRRTAWA